jgi:hypothetical protein
MNAFERHQAIIHGELPDKVGVMAATGLRTGSQGGMFRRLAARGLCLRHIVPPHRPFFSFPGSVNPFLEEVVYSQKFYHHRGHWQIEHTLKTPVGTVNSIASRNLEIDVSSDSPLTHFIKDPADWDVINYVFQEMTAALEPNYEAMERDQDELGASGYTIAFIDKTPFQRAWIELASLERTVFDCVDRPDGFLEYLEIQETYHRKVAEIAAGCPSDLVLINDNITNTISPRYYREFCTPYYQIYTDALRGTDKILAVHHDGLLSQLRVEIASAPFQVVDSFTVPPSGDLDLAEVKAFWPGKIPFVNLPPHLAWSSPEELRLEYAGIVDAWGDTGMVIVHVEDFPLPQVEIHLNAVLDVCGY